MSKKIFFLSGLPRSGNTLLSAILNQNNNIYSSPISILTGIFHSQVEYITSNENFLRSPENKDRYESYLKKIAQNYYDDVDEPIVFDRDKGWGTPYNLEVAKRFINPEPKIIFTVRNILKGQEIEKKTKTNFYPLVLENNQNDYRELIMIMIKNCYC